MIVPKAGLASIPIDEIHPNPKNPRLDLAEVQDLAASIRAVGLIQPLVVHPRAKGGGYELLSGHRRYAALRHLAADSALCLVAPAKTGVDALRVMLVENGQRVALTPMEEARAFEQLLKAGWSQAQIAKGIGRSQTHVSMRIALTHLSPEEQALVESGDLGVMDAVESSRVRRGIAENTRFTGWHFGKHHPLAETVRARCKASDHGTHRRVGGIACGQCWEAVIRDDERDTLAAVEEAAS